MARGLCRGMDTNLFIPPYDPNTRMGPAPEALATCNGTDAHPPCPVKRECLAYGKKYKCSGCWGGVAIYLGRIRRPKKD